MPGAAVNTDVDVAQSNALDALSYFKSKHTGLMEDKAWKAYSKVLLGLPVEMSTVEVAVMFDGDAIATAAVIEYIILGAVHEASQIDNED